MSRHTNNAARINICLDIIAYSAQKSKYFLKIIIKNKLFIIRAAKPCVRQCQNTDQFVLSSTYATSPSTSPALNTVRYAFTIFLKANVEI